MTEADAGARVTVENVTVDDFEAAAVFALGVIAIELPPAAVEAVAVAAAAATAAVGVLTIIGVGLLK